MDHIWFINSLVEKFEFEFEGHIYTTCKIIYFSKTTQIHHRQASLFDMFEVNTITHGGLADPVHKFKMGITQKTLKLKNWKKYVILP